MPLDADDVRSAEELNRLWDARNLGLSAGSSDAEFEFIDRLAACDDAPGPDEAILRRLRASLLAKPVSVSPHAVGIVKSTPTSWPIAPVRRIAVAVALAACLTAIVFGGGGFLRNQAGAPTVASVLASPATTPTSGPTSTVWLASPPPFSFNYEISLAPEVAATAVRSEWSLVAPSTILTVIDMDYDPAGRAWLRVQTSDGRIGWLPRELTSSPGQEQAETESS